MLCDGENGKTDTSLDFARDLTPDSMPQLINPPPHSPRAAIILTLLVGLIATAVAWLGTRESVEPVAPVPAPAVAGVAIESIALPHEDLALPPGPHQRTFVSSCTICHSTRLVMTQPPFPRKKWTEVVQKMIKTYGAPVTPESTEEIAEYLVTVRGVEKSSN